jgi:hypothetical protein
MYLGYGRVNVTHHMLHFPLGTLSLLTTVGMLGMCMQAQAIRVATPTCTHSIGCTRDMVV